MTILEKIESEISALPASEVHKLGEWLDDLREKIWDAQIEADINAGKFDKLAEQALAEHHAGLSKPL